MGTTSHVISESSRRGRPLAEAALRLHVHDLRGPFGFFGAHELRADDGTAVKLRLNVGERHGWARVEHWRPRAAWASPVYDLALFARSQTFGGAAWRFSCPLSGVRTPVLYLPAGTDCLASRQAHGLGYRSQCLTASARAAVRAARIRSALGGDRMRRPPGMHGATFARLAAELARLDGALKDS